jgi:hypothetical protein
MDNDKISGTDSNSLLGEWGGMPRQTITVKPTYNVPAFYVFPHKSFIFFLSCHNTHKLYALFPFTKFQLSKISHPRSSIAKQRM